METSIGIAFNDFVMVATDQTCAQSILMLKDTCEKTYPLTNHLLMSALGESGDTTQFAEFMAKNIQLYKMRNAYEMSPSEAANFTRRNLADYLRSRTPFHVNLLIAGYDKKSDKAELYTMDYLAGMVKTEHASHGYGGIFSSGILDRNYRPDMTVEEGYDLIKTCVAEVQKRLIINLPNFSVQIINKEGTKSLKPIMLERVSFQKGK
ncbi:proteasome subunit beta type-2 [Lepeophtheirus salmonis]|uniref:Proteasome subunit beta n=3 Tax=Lepeophtheirus salmonis TaxID=72036 RepID=C1BTZ6_LEPSM|nr:proteasome subunit beta type-2-like [Lepeophtheirus salmonis]ACO12499.1 Proteasome subunit beta type-2 [Lepeophtheirus salmonis]ADD38406.1 Proteasome subunit beta type-2 [Lepeophtheirus salmonis]